MIGRGPRRLLALCLSATSIGAQQPLISEWRIDAAPVITLEDDGREGTEFQRIVGAWRLANGELVVANSGSSEIRVFSDNGELARTFGRPGSGPGEFQMMRWSWRSADTVFVYDPLTKRVTTIHVGKPVRLVATTTMTAKGGRNYMVIGRLDGGRWLVKSSGDLGWDAAPGVHRVEDALGVVNADGAGVVNWIARSPSMSSFVHNPTRNIKEARVGPAAFSPEFLVSSAGSAVWFGDSETSELVRFEVADGRRHRVKLPLTATPPTKALIAARHLEETQRFRADGSGFLDAKFSATYLPDRLPYFEAVVPAVNGELWVQEYAGLSAAATRYLVLDRSGTPLARVATPPAVRLTDIGSDYVVGVHRDDDGVETVRTYRLIRE